MISDTETETFDRFDYRLTLAGQSTGWVLGSSTLEKTKEFATVAANHMFDDWSIRPDIEYQKRTVVRTVTVERVE